MKFISLLSILALLSLTACSSDDEEGGGNNLLGQTIEIDFGNGTTFDDTGIIISFTGIEDSRCPSDVVCISPGEAKASLTLAGNIGLLETITLVAQGLCFEEDGSCGETKNAQGYSFKLLTINPYPESGVTVTPNEYTLKLIIEKA